MGLLTITVARKPLEGTVAHNTTVHGTGGINIDGCRIATSETLMMGSGKLLSGLTCGKGASGVVCEQHSLGRWPANLILQHLPECRCTGTLKEALPIFESSHTHRWGFGVGRVNCEVRKKGEKPSFSVEKWGCAPGCPVGSLNLQSGQTVSTKTKKASKHVGAGSATFLQTPQHTEVNSHEDSGGASRFFKQISGAPEAQEGWDQQGGPDHLFFNTK